MKYEESLQILTEMCFHVRVIRNGRNRGEKEIWWTTLDGICKCTRFTCETSWEKIIEYASSKLPVWNGTLLFQIGDIIEFDWEGKRIKAKVVAIDAEISHYELESLSFKKGWHGHQRKMGNYDLKFYRNAIKIGSTNHETTIVVT